MSKEKARGKSGEPSEEKPAPRKRRPQRSPSRRAARPAGHSLWKKLGLVLLALLLLCAVALKWKIDSDIREAMEGPTWDVPSLVFAEPVKLYAGLRWGPDDVESLLVDLGYVRQKGAKSPGTYEARQAAVLVHLRALELPDRRRDPLPVAVSFGAGAISELRGPFGELFASVETEAPKVTGFYGPKRQARDPVRLSDVPALLKDAVLVVEDRRFYEHSGLDPRGILRALWADFRARGAVQGGSTVTQQLAKNLFLNQRKTWRRKVVEAVYAMRFESLYPKDAILQAYLNEVYLGADRGLQIGGVAEGSRHYFGLDVRDLDLSKAALLAGLIRGPGTYDPFRRPDDARARRRLVLDLLLQSGRITEAQRDAGDRAPLGLRKARGPVASGSSAYVDAVRSQLADSYSPAMLQTAGLRIYTPLDPRVQGTAQEALDSVLEELERSRRLPAGTLEGAVIVLEPGKGAVRALVGGRGGVPGTFNRALQARRQPGSLMKPFAYAAALESRRFTPVTSLSDAPIELPGKSGPWRPANADGRYRGSVTLRQALEESLNVPSVRLLQALGARPAMELAARAGITSTLTQDFSVVLGTSEVTPLEMATAFATFAAGGRRSEPRFVQGVLSRSGEVLQQREARTSRAVSPDVAFVVNHLLQGTIRRGTARALGGLGYRYALSGKTGTTTGGRDAWFVGYTPRFLALVWVGPDEPRNLDLTGATAALRVWKRLVEALPGCLDAPEPEPPAGVVRLEVDPETGLVATAACAQVVGEWFLAGTEPRERCLHTAEEGRAPLGDELNRDPVMYSP